MHIKDPKEHWKEVVYKNKLNLNQKNAKNI